MAASATDFQQLAEDYIALWNATDPQARGALARTICRDDVRYTDPLADVTGVEALEETIGAVQQQFPGFRFTLAGPVDAHHGQARFGWGLGPEGAGDPPVVGFDVVTADENGRLQLVLGFLDRVPS